MNDKAIPNDISEVNPFFGQAGHLFVILAFVAALISALSYFLSVRAAKDIDKNNWKKLARYSFFTHAASVAGIIITLFIMIFKHHFEYYYVWEHSSLDLKTKYILASFWEGQEGSFLLWSFWHVVLGLVLIFTAKKWEAPVMTFIASIQIFLISFLLGIYIGKFHIGNSPFLLLRDALTQDPVFLFKNYMSFISDGTGLNALLQNYWMVIHPPVLFMGFASISVPFAFAMSGLWTKQYVEWIKPALPFTLFSCMVLGTGVLMGGAWAYEALSFGGFWAWDPVENVSLIPWLVIVAALHSLVVTKSTGYALRTNFVLIFIAFIFVLFASFLTRSGILGDTSVHAFVVSGLENHLLIFLGTFLLVGLALMLRNWNKLPVIKKEESVSSREFWMFIGSLVLLFSAVHIVVFSSIPVYNELFKWINTVFGTSLKTDLSPPASPKLYYTSVQIWIAVIIALLSAFAQYLKYKNTSGKKFFRQISIPVLLAVIITAFSAYALQYPLISKTILNVFGRQIHFQSFYSYTLLLFFSFFSILANLQYLFFVMKGKIKVSGASVAHTGFGVLLLGILISNANQRVISLNTSGVDYGNNFDDKFKYENILMYKNMPVSMGNYIVTYTGDTISNGENIYNIKYEKVDAKTGEITNAFTLHPYLLLDKKSKELTPNPDTKRFLTYDIFTHISSIPTKESKEKPPAEEQKILKMGDTIFYYSGYMILNDIKKYTIGDSVSAGAVFTAFTNDKSEIAEPRIIIAGNQLTSVPVKLKNADVELKFINIIPDKEQFIFTTKESNSINDWVILKAIVFPMINLVWLGGVLMALGFFISLRRRYLENRAANKKKAVASQ